MNYRIKHTLVGEHRQGSIIPASAFKGIDVDRLLNLGAIEETNDPVTPQDGFAAELADAKAKLVVDPPAEKPAEKPADDSHEEPKPKKK